LLLPAAPLRSCSAPPPLRQTPSRCCSQVGAHAVVDKDCTVTSIMQDGTQITRACHNEGVTKPAFVSNAPSHGRFESCTG